MIELYVFLCIVFVFSLVFGMLDECGIFVAIVGIFSGIGVIILTAIMLFGLGF